MKTQGEINQKKYQLAESYLEDGWTLEWDKWGWCCAVHPEYGRTTQSYPNKSSGLKNVQRKIDRLVEEHELNA